MTERSRGEGDCLVLLARVFQHETLPLSGGREYSALKRLVLRRKTWTLAYW